MQEMWARPLGGKDPLGKEMAPHSSILAWEIPQTEEPGRLQSMGLQRVGHDLVTNPAPPWACYKQGLTREEFTHFTGAAAPPNENDSAT